MKKMLKICVCGLAVTMLIAGCSKKEAVAPTESASETTTGESEAEIPDGTVTKLGEYKGIEVVVDSAEVTDEEVETAIQQALAANPVHTEITDRAAALGDIVNIDYVGMKDGVAFEGGTAEGADLKLGSNSFIPGFEEGIVGAKVGDELSLNLAFPEKYEQNPDLAGAAVVFDVTVNTITEEKAAVLDDAFVQTISEGKTVTEYRAVVKAGLLDDKEKASQSKKEYDVLMSVVNASEVDYSDAAVEEIYSMQMQNYASTASMYGMELKDYATLAYGMELEAFEAELRLGSEDAVKQKLVVSAIAEKEGFEVADEDRQYVADLYGTEVDALVANAGQDALDETAMMYKVLAFLAENATVK